MSYRQIPWWGILFNTSARGLISYRGILIEAPGLLVGDRALSLFPGVSASWKGTPENSLSHVSNREQRPSVKDCFRLRHRQQKKPASTAGRGRVLSSRLKTASRRRYLRPGDRSRRSSDLRAQRTNPLYDIPELGARSPPRRFGAGAQETSGYVRLPSVNPTLSAQPGRGVVLSRLGTALVGMKKSYPTLREKS